MCLADYYRANAEDESKLFIYVIYGDIVYGDSVLKDIVITVVGKTLEESKQRWNRILNNSLIEEDQEVLGLEYVIANLNKYSNFRMKKFKVKVFEDGVVYPLMKEIKDEEMIAYEKELLKD